MNNSLRRVRRHIGGNIVGYVALFAALGGTSYAAVTLAPGSVTTQALKNGAVTSAKLAHSSVGSSQLRKGSLTIADFKSGSLANALKGLAGQNGRNGVNGVNGTAGNNGGVGAAGPMGPAGHDGSASISARIAGTTTVTAPHQASTNVPLTGATWTQAANSLNLITGSMTIEIPATCTGSFGNELVVSVDGNPTTIALAPTVPANGTATVPFAVSEVMEPGSDTQHTLKAALANSCAKSGEDYTVSNVKIDVVNFK
jgi:hypothetical protein